MLDRFAYPELQGKDILVAEDDVAIAVDYRFELQRVGAKPAAYAPTNAAALAYLSTHHVDVALIDYELADGSSEPLLQALQKRGIPFVVVTGCAFEMDLHGSVGRCHVLSKPVTSTQVCRALCEELH
jgi:DNA-binding NtrC family response regulator